MRFLTKIVMVVALLASLAFNVATVAVGSIATLVSTAYEAVTGTTSVVGRMRGEVADKDTRIAALARDLELREARITTLARDLELREARIASLSDDVASLREARMVQFRGEKRALGDVVGETTDRIAARTARSATRSVGSAAAEAIPVAGIAVIVGLTAWEVKDACDTMQDLHDLNLAFNPNAGLASEADEVCGMKVPTKEEVWQAVKSSPGAAWEAAKAYAPELPDLPKAPQWSLPEIDWSFWN